MLWNDEGSNLKGVEEIDVHVYSGDGLQVECRGEARHSGPDQAAGRSHGRQVGSGALPEDRRGSGCQPAAELMRGKAEGSRATAWCAELVVRIATDAFARRPTAGTGPLFLSLPHGGSRTPLQVGWARVGECV